MKPFFAIAPWEFPGAKFDPAPHAITTHHIGGRERTLWLKMREGVIFFRDAAQWRHVFAVPQLFDMALATDCEKLVAEFKLQVERGNYGALLTRHQRRPHTFATGHFCIVLRGDGSGWIREFASDDWREFAASERAKLALWAGNNFRSRTSLIVREMNSQFIDREVDPAHFQTVLPHWTGGGSDEMVTTFRSAAQLLLSKRTYEFLAGRPLTWQCSSHSSFAQGETIDLFSPYGYGNEGDFGRVKTLISWHFGFVGVEWNRVTDYPELMRKANAHEWKRWQPGVDKWGENWRGNFIGRQYKTFLSAPALASPSQHDELEAALVMRDFLRDKLPDAKIEALLRDALAD